MKMSELREFHSVKQWLLPKGTFTRGTEGIYLDSLMMICYFLRENPDSLVERVRNNREELEQIDHALATYMDEKLHLKSTTIHDKLSALFSFLRANGILISRDNIKKMHDKIPILKFRKK